MSYKNDARPNALEALHGVIEGHRPILEDAFAERGAMSLLPGPVREAVAEILRAANACGTALAGEENPSASPGRGRVGSVEAVPVRRIRPT